MAYNDQYPGYPSHTHGDFEHGRGHKYGPSHLMTYQPQPWYDHRNAHETASDHYIHHATRNAHHRDARSEGYYTAKRLQRDDYHHTAPVVRQPHSKGSTHNISHVSQHGGGRDWSTGLCECGRDPNLCVKMCCCGPFYSCYMMDKDFGESCWNVVCCGANAFIPVRYRFRDRHGIQGSLLGDGCALTLCTCCAICQLKREKDIVEPGIPQRR